MREIKFRVWDSNNNLMDYNPGLDVDWSRFPLNAFFANQLVDGGPPGEKTNYIFMQFTGLTDKNGKEIYEGDIISHDLGTGVIEWYNARFNIQDHDEVEVIGNIYENTELAK